MNKYIIEKEVREIITFQKREIPKIDWGDNITEEFERSQKIRKIIVERVLDSFEASTNNDFIMFIECLRDEFDIEVTSGKNNFHIVIPRNIIMKIPSPETYTRIRRKFNEEGKYLPTNQNVIHARSKKEKAMREYMIKQKIPDFPDKKQVQDTY